tara:strand:+ start:5458 stop:6810 length:1353 start_codon:yes stop_codon:yes gene_type:complete
MSSINDDIAEKAILANVLRDEENFDKVSPYFKEDGVIESYEVKLLWDKFTELKDKKIPIDLISVCNSLTKEDKLLGLTPDFVIECSEVESVEWRTETYASQLYEKFLLRKVVKKSQEIQDKASGNFPDVYEKIQEAHTLIGNLIDVRPQEKFSVADELGEAISDISSKEKKLINTGYESLNRFAGGLTRGEITIIGGRPGHGKTTCMLNLLVKAVSNGYRVILFNRELPNSEVFKKLICLESNKLSYSMVRKGIYEQSDLDELDRVRKVMIEKYDSDNFLMFDDIRDFTSSVPEIKKFKPDIIFDDYIQLICSSSKDDRRFQIEKLVNDYKWLSKEMQCATVIVSQLNRNVEYRGNKVPQLSDLAESGSIEQVAENVFFVFYEYKADPKSNLGSNVITLCARKVRYGDTGSVNLGYDGDKCTIYNDLNELENARIEQESQRNIDTSDIPF